VRALLLAVLLLPVSAAAQTWAVNAGAIDVIGLQPTAQLGFYPAVGISAAFTRTPFALIPSLSLEGSPDARRWGGVLALTGDYALTGSLGLDLNLALIHDQAGFAFGEALYFLGAGPGVSLYFGRWTLSFWVDAFHGLNVDGWSVVPGFNVGYAFAGVE
jgi:hypothetical protein